LSLISSFYKNNKRKLLASILIIAIIATLIFVFSNSLKSSEQSSDQSSQLAEAIKPVVDPKDNIPFNIFEHHLRKLAHFSEFCLLGFLLFLLLAVLAKDNGKVTLPKYTAALLFLLFTALVDETVQIISQRGSAVLDVWIDFSGAIAGTFIAFLLTLAISFLSKRKTNRKNKAPSKV